MWKCTRVTNQHTNNMPNARKWFVLVTLLKISTFPLKRSKNQNRAEKHLIYPLPIVRRQFGTFWSIVRTVGFYVKKPSPGQYVQ